MLHDRAELRWLHEAVNPTTASCRSWEASFVLSEVDDTSILRTGLPTPSRSPLSWLPTAPSRPRAAGWSAATSCDGTDSPDVYGAIDGESWMDTRRSVPGAFLECQLVGGTRSGRRGDRVTAISFTHLAARAQVCNWHDAEVLAGATTSAAIWGTRDLVDALATGPPLTQRRTHAGEPDAGEGRASG